MTDEQADEIYRGTVLILRKEGIDWIVDEAESAIRAGKTEASEVMLDTPSETEARHRRRATGVRHTRRDWTPEERLAILLDAVDAAVCKPPTMESDITALLPEMDGREMVFAPGESPEDLSQDGFRERLLRLAATEADDLAYRPPEPYILRLDQGRSKRQENASLLLALLQSVRKELNVDLD